MFTYVVVLRFSLSLYFLSLALLFVFQISSVRGICNQAVPLLPPTFGKDDIGHHICVVCGNFTAQLYVGRLDLSKRAVGKCVLYSGKWYTPSEFEKEI